MRGETARSSPKKILRTFSNRTGMRSRCIGLGNGDRNINNRSNNRLSSKVPRGQSNPKEKNKLSTNPAQRRPSNSSRIRNSLSMTGKSMTISWRTDTKELGNSRMITRIFMKVNSILPDRSRLKEGHRVIPTARELKDPSQTRALAMTSLSAIVLPIRIKVLKTARVVEAKMTTTSNFSIIPDFWPFLPILGLEGIILIIITTRSSSLPLDSASCRTWPSTSTLKDESKINKRPKWMR